MGAGDAVSPYRIVPYQPAHRGAVIEPQRHLWSDDAGRSAVFRRFDRSATARRLTVSTTPRSSAMAALVSLLP
jgi:hypothetical protein